MPLNYESVMSPAKEKVGTNFSYKMRTTEHKKALILLK